MSPEIATIFVAGIISLAPTGMAYLSWKSSRENSKKADVITVKTNEIHQLANSQLTTVTASLEAANKKIDGLEKLVVTLAERTNPPPSDGRRPRKSPILKVR
jgi:hypothetical protein